MRAIRYAVMVCAAAVFVGCATTYDDRDARGGYTDDYGIYEGSGNARMAGPNSAVNRRYFGPVNSGIEAARGPGTPSGFFDNRP